MKLMSGEGSGVRSRVRMVVSGFGFLIASAGVAHAAGAMAIGSCAAYGFAYDYSRMDDAQTAAMDQCTGKDCKVVATMQRACVAYAIDGRHACGPHGFAVAGKLGQAENSALRFCYKYGGKDCVIRAWACDGKG
jgi:hypothetical protein